jgi:DUF971 family protein
MTAPTELRLSKDKRTLTVSFADATLTLSAEQLRVNSPSAEVKGHFGQGGTIPTGKQDVTITGLEPVGNYAVKITFSDGHRTGLYTWDYLRQLGRNPPS